MNTDHERLQPVNVSDGSIEEIEEDEDFSGIPYQRLFEV